MASRTRDIAKKLMKHKTPFLITESCKRVNADRADSAFAKGDKSTTRVWGPEAEQMVGVALKAFCPCSYKCGTKNEGFK